MLSSGPLPPREGEEGCPCPSLSWQQEAGAGCAPSPGEPCWGVDTAGQRGGRGVIGVDVIVHPRCQRALPTPELCVPWRVHPSSALGFGAGAEQRCTPTPFGSRAAAFPGRTEAAAVPARRPRPSPPSAGRHCALVAAGTSAALPGPAIPSAGSPGTARPRTPRREVTRREVTWLPLEPRPAWAPGTRRCLTKLSSQPEHHQQRHPHHLRRGRALCPHPGAVRGQQRPPEALLLQPRPHHPVPLGPCWAHLWEGARIHHELHRYGEQGV